MSAVAEEQAPPPATPPQAHVPRWAVVGAALPARLSLVLLWSSLVVGVLVTAGQLRPWLVVPLVLVALVATWRLVPAEGPASRGAGLGGLLAVGLAVGFAVVNAPFASENLLVDRDPDIYTLTAWWLVDNPAPGMPSPSPSLGGAGFPVVEGLLRPQGQHLAPALAAVPGWVLGYEAVLAANIAIGACALLAVYWAGRTLVGPWWALLPPTALSVSLPMLAFSRSLYTEPVAMALFWTGCAALVLAVRHGRARDLVLAGTALGAVSLARIDGLLVVIGLAVALAGVVVTHPSWWADRRRWWPFLVLVAAVPWAVLAYLDVLLWAGPYIRALAPQLLLMRTAAVAAVVLTLVLVAVPWPQRLRERVARAWPALLGLGAVGVLAAFAVLLTRPWWYVARFPIENTLVSGLQGQAGVPQDPFQTYAELSLNWMAWFVGWPSVVLGVLGLPLLVLLSRHHPERLVLVLVALPTTLVYLWQPSITPDQVWAVRRFLPVAFPVLLLGAAFLLDRLTGSPALRGGRGRRVAAGALAAVGVLAVVVPTGVNLDQLFRSTQKSGVQAGVERFCDQVGDRPTVVVGANTYLPTVIAVCQVPAVRVVDGSAQGLADAVAALGTDEASVVTGNGPNVAWQGEVPAPTVTIATTVWERVLFGPPHRTLPGSIALWVGTVDADGTAVPAEVPAP